MTRHDINAPLCLTAANRRRRPRVSRATGPADRPVPSTHIAGR